MDPVAALLGDGRTLSAAAEEMAVARNTARNHLQTIFAKTETRSQVELVRLLMRLLPR